ncbi:MAG: Ig domain-containing protein [Bryobacteraceae bacterium]
MKYLVSLLFLPLFAVASFGQSNPLNATESGDYPSFYLTNVYNNIGTLGSGVNVISGAVSGQPQGVTYIGDFDDAFSVTLPSGMKITKIQAVISNFDTAGVGLAGCNPDGPSPSGLFNMPTVLGGKCLGGGGTTYTYNSPGDFTSPASGTVPIYFASPYNTTRLQAGAYSYTLMITVSAPSTPITIVTAPTLPSGSIGIPYQLALQATGGLNYTWQLLSGALPPGLSLSASGVISGTPTVTGSASFSARAVDTDSFLSASQTFTLAITTQLNNYGTALRVPHLVEGNGWRTMFAIVNIDAQPVEYTFRFWGNDGSSLPLPLVNRQPGSLTGTLAAGATVFAETPGSSPQEIQGWAEVASTGRIGVTTIFRYTGGGLDMQGTANAIFSASSVYMPFDNTQGNITGIALANTNAANNVSVTVTFKTDNGAQSTATVVLPPHGHTTFVLPTSFPATANARGAMNVSATSADLVLLGLRFTPSLSFTSLGAFQ